MNARATAPATPIALRRDAGRYSIVSERDTMPPGVLDAADIETFERDIAKHGESQARLRNMHRVTQP